MFNIFFHLITLRLTFYDLAGKYLLSIGKRDWNIIKWKADAGKLFAGFWRKQIYKRGLFLPANFGEFYGDEEDADDKVTNIRRLL